MLHQLHFSNRFFYALCGVIIIFCFSFFIPSLFYIAVAILLFFVMVVVVNIFQLFRIKNILHAERKLHEIFSLHDDNTVKITLQSHFNHPISVQLIDELPFQFQERNQTFNFTLQPNEPNEIAYKLKPTERGEYHFGNIQILFSNTLGICQRHITIKATQKIIVFPSIIQMKKYELEAAMHTERFDGVKKVRKLGLGNEFEQIRPYSVGDDYRDINWKATSRKNDIMVNQFEDEKSQPVYCIIDKSRNMQLPFDGLSLMDYSINTALALSNIILKNGDKAGLISFSKNIGTTIKADNKTTQLHLITQKLYNQNPVLAEPNFEMLYTYLQYFQSRRSMIILFSNFENTNALENALPLLRKINKSHLLVVVLFKNTEIEHYVNTSAQNVEEIYTKTIAQKLEFEKIKIAQMLRTYGIQSIYTAPSELSLQTINQYFKVKARKLL